MNPLSIDKRIYCFWTGDNPITENRIIGLDSMKQNLGVEIDFIDQKTLPLRIKEEHPLHPGYKYLSNNHKSDYLRCYFMHFFGGGYSDIKQFSTDNNWKQCFQLINDNNEIDIIGSKEIQNGSPHKEYNKNPDMLSKLLQNGWFICRPQTEFTKEWYKRLMDKMDERYDCLKKYPATEPFGGKTYKLRWAEIQGEIFHKLIIDMYDQEKIKNCLINGRLNKPYR